MGRFEGGSYTDGQGDQGGLPLETGRLPGATLYTQNTLRKTFVIDSPLQNTAVANERIPSGGHQTNPHSELVGRRGWKATPSEVTYGRHIYRLPRRHCYLIIRS